MLARRLETYSRRLALVGLGVCAMVVALWLNVSTAPVSQVRASHGVLDLSNWEFASMGPVKLDGDWEFHWRTLMEPGDFAGGQDYPVSTYLGIPGSWDGHMVAGEKLGGDGYGTLRLVVRTPDLDGRLLGLKIPFISSAYRLWVNGELAAANGVVGDSPDTVRGQMLHRTIFFPANGAEIEIVAQTANYQLNRGVVRSILLGTQEQIMRLRGWRLGLELLVAGCLLVMGLHYLLLFGLRRREISFLLFSVLCLLIALRTVLYGEMVFSSLFPHLNVQSLMKVAALTFTLGVPAFAFFVHNLYPEEMGWRWVRAMVVGSAAMSAAVVTLPHKVFMPVMIAYEVLAAFFLVYTAVALTRAAWTRRQGAAVSLAGSAILSGTVFNDILYDNVMVQTGSLVPFGLLAFVLAQSMVLSVRLSEAFAANERLSEELLVANQMKDEFFANTSHELRTPLDGMVGLADSLLRGAAGPLTDQQRSSLSLLVASGRRLGNLVNDLLDLTRLRYKDLVLHQEAVELSQVVDIVLGIHRFLINGRDLELVNKVPPELPLVWADVDRVQQILHNLVDNAVKYTNAGTVTVSASVHGEYVEVIVSDTGQGIPEEKLASVLSAPVSSNEDRSSASEMGLGLAIVQQLVQLHGGCVWVSSKPDIGSQFGFSLPVSKRQTGPAREAAAAIWLSEPAAEDSGALRSAEVERDLEGAVDLPKAKLRQKILVVDDDPVQRQVLVHQLAVGGHEAEGIASGMAALQRLEHEPVDLLVVDLLMPGMSGYQVCRAVRRRYSKEELPILLLSGGRQSEALITGLNAGANDFLAKPFGFRELVNRVENLLALKRSVQLANIDSLTGVYTRRHFFELAEGAFGSAKLYRHPLAVFMLDIDHFKEFNDTYGHAIGDSVLRLVAERCRYQLRAGDIVGRYGGEEFAVLLPQTDLTTAAAVAQRIKNAVSDQPFAVEQEKDLVVTVSVGVAALVSETEDVDELIAQADAGLLQAKTQGRNMIVVQE